MVSDDGVGFDPSTINSNEGMGLAGMRERAARLGGSLSVESSVGSGTIVTLRMNRFVVEKAYTPV